MTALTAKGQVPDRNRGLQSVDGDPLDQAWNWLAEVLERVAKGRPPVTEEELRELQACFQGQEDHLRQQ